MKLINLSKRKLIYIWGGKVFLRKKRIQSTFKKGTLNPLNIKILNIPIISPKMDNLF